MNTCRFCGEEIYFGPRDEPKVKTYATLDTSWSEELWRHTSTQMSQCACRATPVD